MNTAVRTANTSNSTATAVCVARVCVRSEFEYPSSICVCSCSFNLIINPREIGTSSVVSQKKNTPQIYSYILLCNAMPPVQFGRVKAYFDIYYTSFSAGGCRSRD